MTKYTVYISPQAYRDLDEIYEYITNDLFAEAAAIRLIDDIENAILSLEENPERGAERKVGMYAFSGYRQLFVKNYTIVYRVDDAARSVMIVTVRYSHRNF